MQIVFARIPDTVPSPSWFCPITNYNMTVPIHGTSSRWLIFSATNRTDEASNDTGFLALRSQIRFLF